MPEQSETKDFVIRIKRDPADLSKPEDRRLLYKLLLMFAVQFVFMAATMRYNIMEQISNYFVSLRSPSDPTGPMFNTITLYSIIVYLVVPALLVYAIAPRVYRLFRRQ